MPNQELQYINRVMTNHLTVPLACVGLGQFGGKLVVLLAGFTKRDGSPYYRCCAVNSYAGDLQSLRNIPRNSLYQIRGVEAGGGRMPELVKAALLDESTENQSNLYDLLDATASDAPYLMIAAGLGGGTGTGLIWGLLDWIKQGFMPRPCGLILTLPRPEDGPRQHINAAKALLAILRQMAEQPRGPLSQLSPDVLRRRINSIILIDNGLLYREWKAAGERNDWMAWGNQVVSEHFHEMNVIASNANGDVNFDAADFGKLLLYSGACVTYARLKWDGQADYGQLGEEARQAVAGGLFSTGYDFSTASFWGGTLMRSANRPANDAKLRDAVESTLRSLAPNRDDDKLGIGQWNHPSTMLYLGVSGLEMPQRVADILRTAKEEEVRLREQETARAARAKALLNTAASDMGTEAAPGAVVGQVFSPGSNPFKRPDQAPETRNNPWRKSQPGK